MNDRPLSIWTLNDGKAGHFNQSRAIVMALGRSLPVVTENLGCKLRVAGFQRPLRWLLNRTDGRLPRTWFRVFHAAGEFPANRPDLIVSAGGNTCGANVWLSRRFDCANLFCGSTRGLHDNLFGGLVTPHPEHEGNPRYIVSPTPVPIDPVALAAEAAAFRKRLTPPEARCWGLLVGGNGAGYHYTKMDWENLADAMKQLTTAHGIRWLVATSRRSGALAESALTSRLDARTIAGAAYLQMLAPTPVKYAELLGATERLFCTEDSHMMISEAIATGKPVHTLRPARYKTDPTNLHFLNLYEKDRLISRHDIAGMATVDFSRIQLNAGIGPSVMDQLAEKLAVWCRGQPRLAG